MDDEDPRADRRWRWDLGGPRYVARHWRADDGEDHLRTQRLVCDAGRVGYQEISWRLRGIDQDEARSPRSRSGMTAPAATQSVTLTIEGRQVTVPAGTTILEAAKQAGVLIPH